jgi:hypothetical protein
VIIVVVPEIIKDTRFHQPDDDANNRGDEREEE